HLEPHAAKADAHARVRLCGGYTSSSQRCAGHSCTTREECMAESGTIAYGVVEGWEQLPTGYMHRDVAGVTVDGEDRVYLICRGDHPIIVYDQQGNFLRS